MISLYLERQALKRPANAKSSCVQMVCKTANGKIMNKISELDLTKLMGGVTMEGCDYLQEMAAEHEELDDQEAEDAWWEAWGEAFERCAFS